MSGPALPPILPPALLIDGHAHLYPCFDVGRWLAAAQANLAVARRAAGLDAVTPGVLLMTETAAEGAFARLKAGIRPPWRLERPEEAALVLRGLGGDPGRSSGGSRGRAPDGHSGRSDSPPLVIVAGRQIQTAERIEVLAVASARPWPDGRPLVETLDVLAAEGVTAILPWGVGKWLGRRGRIVAGALAARPSLLLGDNAGRPVGWPAPRAFADRIVLPGTDPLPRPGAEAGVGRYGFVLDGCLGEGLEGGLDLTRPATDLRDRLARLEHQPRCFGRRAGSLRAALDQVRLRLPG